MLRVSCTEVFRDKSGNITGYRLKDANGVSKDIQKDALKDLIRRKEIIVDNLTLTSNNRLVSTTVKESNELTVKVKLYAEIEPGTFNDIQRSLYHNIEGFIDFDGNTEIKSVGSVVVAPVVTKKKNSQVIMISMNVTIERTFLNEFKGYIGHHIDYIVNIDDYPEIINFFNCGVI